MVSFGIFVLSCIFGVLRFHGGSCLWCIRMLESYCFRSSWSPGHFFFLLIWLMCDTFMLDCGSRVVFSFLKVNCSIFKITFWLQLFHMVEHFSALIDCEKMIGSSLVVKLLLLFVVLSHSLRPGCRVEAWQLLRKSIIYFSWSMLSRYIYILIGESYSNFLIPFPFTSKIWLLFLHYLNLNLFL